ncbi:MAG: CusA/CzcA family heavy metal efflux RND transporter [Bacteroidetes bacterium]|nr:CusA/CzcA family heavy metal efflux RND transporter [Bacteroidota bacterium]
MLKYIIGFSIRNKLIIGLFTLGLIIYGALSLRSLPIDAVPDITNNQVLVITSSPSLGAADIERVITFPIEMATRNIPGIIEQRSFSRFGLSLVTIVFDDKTDVYWARQQIAERLVQVQGELPPGLGTPTLGPVTTGLGEIFQYVVRPRPGYENRYSDVELRTIQDWIVRKQLLGTKGIADVSSFGGHLKQYEVEIDPARLRAHSLTIQDVMGALQRNNQNTGGAYIEKGPTVLYIRSEGLVKTEEDIGTIPVRTVAQGVPLLIRDIAKVKIGSAIRYGAMTYNDKGEVAGGIVMMLKGGNSSEVIKAVKQRIAEIQKTLPEGVEIEAFLDRTKMVNNAISTVEKNLVEGALIVIFILVIFLGNIRAGMLVASVIPLAMLFAIIMMNIFGVSGNLMSLGALDFGLIVDGAVIIVEAVMHRLHQGHIRTGEITGGEMDAEVNHAAGKMMSAAVFGQIIILIVYLPILTLEGIEGKMFKPMAETVAFAIVGAFILSVTYVPMMASVVLSRRISSAPSLADRAMAIVERTYEKILKTVLRMPAVIIGTALVLFLAAIGILFTMGGEFIPKLEEGDFAIDTRVLTGSSLSTSIHSTQQAAHILLARFPEVEKVVTKIGSGEIPTDPMPMEASDMMVVLKPKAEWKSAKTFDDLAEKMNKALEDVPGITTGFQFPVQMRFNELMTGGRQDVVCKIFGDNLDTLTAYSRQVAQLVNSIKGARDLYVESVTGLPQIVIHYNRDALAQYGLSVAAVNEVIKSSLAGAACGMVYEGEKRFDLVVRVGEKDKRELADIQNLLVLTPSGQQLPLYQVADVQIQVGPNQIQREDAQRRISLGFNVRGNDVQTVVQDLQSRIAAKVKLPPGYYMTYGGQFENLVAAKKRLSITLPVGLLLIFVMLFFAFHSVRQGLLIFSAIPLSAIGGVLALWLRGMPFSISAGVGFIALFGVAVLNGIVLISEFNALRDEGITDLTERILTGTRTRLRPVLMTAAVASLGFLPMAMSSGAGAEVQRPLATVVIGGLITATLLTLIVLPLIYVWSERRGRGPSTVTMTTAILVTSGMLLPSILSAQPTISLHRAIDSAMLRNLSIQASTLRVSSYQNLEHTAWDLPATSASGEYGQINSIYLDSKFSVSQSIAFPLLYTGQKALYRSQTGMAEAELQISRRDIERQVAGIYYDMVLLQQKRRILVDADSMYSTFVRLETARYSAGDIDAIEKAASESAGRQIRIQLQQLDADYAALQLSLSRLMRSSVLYDPADTILKLQTPVQIDTALYEQHLSIQYMSRQAESARHEWQVARWKLLPQFTLGYSNQSINGYMRTSAGETYYTASSRFQSGFVGIGIPVFFQAGDAHIRAARENYKRALAEYEEVRSRKKTERQILLLRYQTALRGLEQYELTSLPQAQAIRAGASRRLQQGSINYIEWMMLVNQSLSIRTDYLSAVDQYNKIVLDLSIYFKSNQ